MKHLIPWRDTYCVLLLRDILLHIIIVKCLQVKLVHLYGLASSWTYHLGLFANSPCYNSQELF